MIYKKSLKGFTLIELIIAMALLSIILVMISMIIKPVGAVYSDVKQYTGDRTVIEETGEYVANSIRYSTDVYIFDGCKPNDTFIASADKPLYTLIRMKNDDFDQWVDSSHKYTGRVSIQRTYTSASTASDYVRALGKAFYGREHYEFSFKWGQKYDPAINAYVEDKKIPVIVVSSFQKDNNGIKGNKYLTAESAVELLNATPKYIHDTTDPDFSTYSTGAETGVIYIIFKKNV